MSRFALVCGSSAVRVSVGHLTLRASSTLSLSSLWRTGRSSYSRAPQSTGSTACAENEGVGVLWCDWQARCLEDKL